MSFAWDGRQLHNLNELDQYLTSLGSHAFDWVKGLTVHHTYIPDVDQWHGSGTMAGLAQYYQYEVVNPDGSKGWSAGPHLFIAPDGIWIGTPPNQIGIHAGVCNRDHIGMEVVGNYDTKKWAEPINSLALGAIVLFVNHAHFPTTAIVGHRDCASPKTCPGKMISLPEIRQAVTDILDNRQPTPPVVRDKQVIGVADQSISLAQFLAAIKRNGPVVLSDGEATRIYQACTWLNVDAAFLLALWVKEGGRPLGSSELQTQSHVWINIKAMPDDTRPFVAYHGSRWYAAESYQLGGLMSLYHLKNTHGTGWDADTLTYGTPRLNVREIIPVHAPPSENDTEKYIKDVLDDMDYMKAH